MKSDDPIMAGLRRIARAKQAVDLLNVYKGVPVVYKAALQRLGDAEADIRVQQYEAVCLTLEKTTTILNDLLDEPVSANVLAADLPAGTAMLGKFRYASSRVGERMILRVAPQNPIEVEIDSGGQKLNGALADLSMNGLGVYVSPGEAADLRPRAVAQLTLPLPAATLKLAGTIRYLKTEANAGRVGITFVQDTRALPIIQYIHERQAEILRELQALYQAAAQL